MTTRKTTMLHWEQRIPDSHDIATVGTTLTAAPIRLSDLFTSAEFDEAHEAWIALYGPAADEAMILNSGTITATPLLGRRVKQPGVVLRRYGGQFRNVSICAKSAAVAASITLVHSPEV